MNRMLSGVLLLGMLAISACSAEPVEETTATVESSTESQEEYIPTEGTRFKNLWDGSAYDRLTDLQWELKTKGSGCGHCVENRYSWSSGSNNQDGTVFTEFLDAMNNTCDGDEKTRCDSGDDCKGIGNALCGHAGFSDWRLPTKEELQGFLLEPFECFLDPCYDASFPGEIRNSAYWSSTLHPKTPSAAYAVFLNNGFIGSGPKAGEAYAIAVRKANRKPR